MTNRVAFTTAMLLLTVGCNNAGSYSGDGKFVDNGMGAATDRYVLDLGPLPIAATGTQTYRLRNLPSENFVLGIEVRRPTSSQASLDARPINAAISMELQDDKGNVIVQRQGSLKDWTWSVHSPGAYAFVYGKDPHSTFFTPGAASALQLKVSVIQSQVSAAEFIPRIVAKSGGWK